jgi:hypothetical protein
MWDTTADNWRVTQVNASGVALSRDVKSLRPPPKQFARAGLRPEPTGPQSHIEAFGRRAAKSVIDESRMIPDPRTRSVFLSRAAEALGPQTALKARAVADRLVKAGQAPDAALEDVLAHCMMNATMRDLADRAKNGGGLPRLDKMSAGLRMKQGEVRKAAADHLQPLVSDQAKLQSDLGAFYGSPSGAALGQVDTAPPATPTSPAVTAAPSSSPTLFTPRNVVIGVAVIGLGYLAATKTKMGREVTENAARGFRRVTGMKRGSRKPRRK